MLKRVAGYGQSIESQQRPQLRQQATCRTSGLELLDQTLAYGTQSCEHGHLMLETLEHGIDVDMALRFAGHGLQMLDAIDRAPHGQHCLGGILKSLLGQDLARAQIIPDHLHDARTCGAHIVHHLGAQRCHWSAAGQGHA